MRKTLTFKKIFSVLLCLAVMVGVFTTTALAAKEMFREITDAGVIDIDEPVAGKKGDYTATVVNTGRYTVENIDYYETATNKLKPSTETFKYDTEYYVLVTIKCRDSDYFATSQFTGEPAVAVTCNESAAMVVSVGDNNKTEIGIKAFFKKTASDPNAKTESNTDVTIPTETLVSEVNVTGVTKPMPGQYPDVRYLKTNDSRVQLSGAEWMHGTKTLEYNDRFEYGETYILTFYINVWSNYEFAKDYSHILATPEKPMAAVKVTLDGETGATVLPDYAKNSNMAYLKVSMTYKCDTKSQVDTIRIDKVTPPVSGEAPAYTCAMSYEGYKRIDRTDAYYSNGMCWSVLDGSYLENTGKAFSPLTRYQVDIRLKAEDGYEFATNSSGSLTAIAQVNGQNATVSGNKNEVIVTYTFPETSSIAMSKAGVSDIDTPEAGNTPDYDVLYTNVNYGPANYNDSTTKNGVSWYNETDGKHMTSSSKFEEGKEYSVSVIIWTNDGYLFSYKNGAVNVAGTVNSKKAEVTSRSDVEVTLYYKFPAIEEHECDSEKIDEVKATCLTEGKKAHYVCTKCGAYYEDSGCKNEISDIETWGIIEKKEHRGGKATCLNLAECTECGSLYGEIAEHNYGSGWDYKDGLVHSHVCRTCGAPDLPVPHFTSTPATCGKASKCDECKAEFGEVMQHQWTDNWAYTDSKGHAHNCTLCDEHDTVVPHVEGPEATESSSQNCTECGFVIEPAINHKHKLSKVSAVKETCTANGKIQHYVCDGCGKLFADSKANEEIASVEETVIPATGHKESKWKTDENFHWKECTSCKLVIEETNNGHEFNDKNKCTECGFRREAEELEPPVDTETPDEETPDTETPDEETPDAETPVDPDDIKENEDQIPVDEAENTDTPWVIIAIAAAVVIVGVIAATVVIGRKNK